MSLKINVPTISITPENEEDDDHNCYSLAEALTDIEELDMDNEKVSKNRIRNRRKNKPKLLVKVSNDFDSHTDVEDLEGSDNEENALIMHEKPMSLEDLDLEPGTFEESCKLHLKNKSKKRLKSQFSITKSVNNSLPIYHDQVCLTDTEDVYNSDNDEPIDIPECIVPTELYTCCDSINISDSIIPNRSLTPSLENASKSMLMVNEELKFTPTDVELLSDSDNEVKTKKNKKVRRRRPKGSLRNRGAVTDIEDVDLSVDEARRSNIFKKNPIKEYKQSTLKTYQRQSMLYDTDNEDEDDFVIRKKKTNKILMIPDEIDDGMTDIDDLNLSDIENYEYDDTEINKQLHTMAQCYSNVKDKANQFGQQNQFQEQSDDSSDGETSYRFAYSGNMSYLSKPYSQDNVATDLESLHSGDEERRVNKVIAIPDGNLTELEEYSDNEQILCDLATNFLPKSMRELILIKENSLGKPTVVVQDLDDIEITLGLNYDVSEQTDVECVSEEEMFLTIEGPRRCPTPDLPTIEGGDIKYVEDLRTKLLSSEQLVREPLTDTEELILDNKKSKKNFNKLLNQPRKYSDQLTLDLEASKTDVEDLYMSDIEKKDYFNIKVTNIEVLTDVENLDLSEDDIDVVPRDNCCTPDLMREMGGDFILSRENDTVTRNLNSLKPHNPSNNCTWSPMVTDTEDVQASAEDDNTTTNLSTPSEMQKDFNDHLVSDVSSCTTRTSNVESASEVGHLKGLIRESNTDVEDVDVAEANDSVSIDWKNGSVIFGLMKDGEWDAPGRGPVEQPIQPPEKLDAPTSTQQDAAFAEEVTYESVLLANFGRNLPSPDPETIPPVIYKTTSYTEIDAMLDRMLTEVEHEEKIILLQNPCVNTLELIPSNDALIEVPIKKSIRVPKRYETTQEIVVENASPFELVRFGNPNSKPREEHVYDLISFEDAAVFQNVQDGISQLLCDAENEESALLLAEDDDEVPYKTVITVRKASSESLSELSDAYPDSWDDYETHDYEPVEAISYKTFNNDIWYEGTYRNLSIVPEEDEENISLCENQEPKYTVLPETDSEDSSDDYSQEKIIKAEVKLLVKTSEGGKDEIEIRSVREFLETETASIINYEDEEAEACLIDYAKPRDSKPVFTLQRLFIRTPKESDLGSNKDLSRSKLELISAPSKNFPLALPDSQSCSNLHTTDLYANTPFYPCYNSTKSCPTTPVTSNNPFIEFVTPHSQFVPPKAYCDWIPQTEAHGGEASGSSWQQTAGASSSSSGSAQNKEKDEARAVTPPEHSQFYDQHQLSDEMKELLREMEKESKK